MVGNNPQIPHVESVPAIHISPLRRVEGGRWFVLHTRSRQEKRLAEELSDAGIACFLPLVKQVRFYSKRKAEIDTPLFPGYIFLHGTAEQAYYADRTRRLAQIITVHDQQQRHVDWELENLALALAHEAPLDPYPCLKKGVRVEVRSGPFRGLQGLVEDRARIDRLILQVQMLGRATSLEVDASLLDILN